MIRRILGFALVAIVALLVLKIALGLLGVLIGLAVSIAVLAAMGYAFYIVLRVLSSRTADRIREAIRGTPRTTADAWCTVMLAPIRANSGTCIKRFSKIVSVIIEAPSATAISAITWACRSVGNPG